MPGQGNKISKLKKAAKSAQKTESKPQGHGRDSLSSISSKALTIEILSRKKIKHNAMYIIIYVYDILLSGSPKN